MMPYLFPDLPFFLGIPLTFAVYFGGLILMTYLFGKD